MNCYHNNRIILEMSSISKILLFTRVIMLQLLSDVDRLAHVRLAGSGLRWNPPRPTNLLIPPDNNGAHSGHRLSSVFIHRPKNAVIAQIERPDCLFWGNPFAVPLASPGTDFHRSGVVHLLFRKPTDPVNPWLYLAADAELVALSVSGLGFCHHGQEETDEGTMSQTAATAAV